MGRLGAPFSTYPFQLKIVTDTNRVGSTATCCIARSSIADSSGAEVIRNPSVRIAHVHMLIATENARALAQIMNCANGKAIGLARARH